MWRLMVPPLSQKWIIFTNLGQGLSQKVDFFLIFEPILPADFFLQNVGSFKQKSTFVLVSGLLAAVFSQFCSNIINESLLKLLKMGSG